MLSIFKARDTLEERGPSGVNAQFLVRSLFSTLKDTDEMSLWYYFIILGGIPYLCRHAWEKHKIQYHAKHYTLSACTLPKSPPWVKEDPFL